MFRNSRVLLFMGSDATALTALVLMRRLHPEGPETYALVEIQDVLGTPVVERPTTPDAGGTDSDLLIWSAPDATHAGDPDDLKTWPVPGARILPDRPTEFAIAPPETDDFEWHLYAPGKPVALIIDDLTDVQGRAEHKADEQTEGYGSYLRRSIFTRRHDLGEVGHWVWFEADGMSYVADKADWDLWMRSPHTSEEP